MSLDERLFAWAWRRLHRRRASSAVPLPQTVRLADLQPHLTLVARALSGTALEIRAAEHVGGWRGEVLYLPACLSTAPTYTDNVQAYLYRLAYTVTTHHQGLCLEPQAPSTPLYQHFRTLLAVPPTLRMMEAQLPMTLALREHLFPLLLATRPPWPGLDTAAACLEALTQILLGRPLPTPEATPGWTWLRQALAAEEGATASLWSALQHLRQSASPPVAPVVLWGQLLSNVVSGPSDTHDPAQAHTAFPSGTTRPGKPKEYVQSVKLDQRDIANDVLIHTFDKIETAEEFQGLTRTPDGADELAQHAEALDELDLRAVVRSATRTQSLYQADVLLDTVSDDLTAVTPPPATAYLYDEWDMQTRRYKPHWCTVYAQRPAPPAPQAAAAATALLQQHQRLIRDLRGLMHQVRSQRVLRNRQPEGAEVDLDALVERYATVRSGHAPDDRLYLARRRQPRDVTTVLLLDLSASTDAWIAGTRVFDIARAAVLVLAEVLVQWHDRVAVAGFYSHTRRDCRFLLCKAFDAPWPPCQATLASLEPTGYTRIGPALRHATALLQRQPAAKKLLLLISDGKPTDYDRYEGRYGIADVRQAIREAQQAHIHPYALAVDVQAKQHLPQMFGDGNFQILPHPTQLVRRLADLYRRLAH